MATTRHLAVRDALAAAYQANPPLSPRILENRKMSLPEGLASQIQVYRVDSRPDLELIHSSAPIDWTTTLRTVIKARKSGATTAEAVADDLMAACYARVMADQTLGGTVMELSTGDFSWDQDEGDTTVAIVTWDLTVLHRTQNNVIT